MTSNTIEDLSNWDTYKHTQSRTAKPPRTVEVSASGLVDAKTLYEQNWVSANTNYSPGSYNSNYAVNSVIYSAGGSVPGGMGWTPEFRTPPASIFYPYIYRDE